MSANASVVPSPVLEGDAPLPFADTNVLTPTWPAVGPTFTPAKMYHTWKNTFIHTPSKWHTPSPSNVRTVSTSSTDSLAPKEATTVSLRGPGNTPYLTIISFNPLPLSRTTSPCLPLPTSLSPPHHPSETSSMAVLTPTSHIPRRAARIGLATE